MGKGDIVLCQITSQRYSDPTAIELLGSDLKSGSLNRTSYFRPGKLFTANETIVAKTIGKVSHQKLVNILDTVIALFEASK